MISHTILRRGLIAAPFPANSCRGFASANGLVNLTVNDKTGIATLELNRPPINSLNTALLTDITSALDELTKNRSKGMILTSVSTNKTIPLNHTFDQIGILHIIHSRRNRYFRVESISWNSINRCQKKQKCSGRRCRRYGSNCMVHRFPPLPQSM